MKIIITLLFSIFFFGVGITQINLELISPPPVLQDSDVGAMTMADIDNDGDLDLMLTGKNVPGPTLSTLYTNDGNGNFTEVTGTPFINVFGGAVGFEDVDGDGFLDLLITGRTHGGTLSTNLYINDTAGNFTLMAGTPFEDSDSGDLAFGDVDNDGDQDVLITGLTNFNSLTGHSTLYENDGTGVFSEVTGTPFVDLYLSSVEFIDIENDNDIDVILAGFDDNDVASTTLYVNDGAGNYSLVPNTPFSNFGKGDITIADSDNDGDEDILISGTDDTEYIAKLYENDGAGSFSVVSGTPFPGTAHGETDFGDFDNDGDVDVLMTGVGNGGIISNIYINEGSNNFALEDILIGAYASSTAIGDVDGDGDLDAFIGGTTFTQPPRATRAYINVTTGPLPVELVSFHVKPSGKKSVKVSWQTASERNNDYFSIEHSTDEFNFQEIGRQIGQGTSSTVHNYSFSHEDLENGWHYYRLKQIDFDEKYEYSSILSARIDDVVLDLVLMPNPASDKVSIQAKTTLTKTATLEIINTQGQVLESVFLESNEEGITIDFSGYPNGMYYVKFVCGGNSIIKKVLKNEK